MAIALVTGSSGLIGSETVRFFHERGLDVVGIDNDMRAYFFGPEASIQKNTRDLCASLSRFSHHAIDIRDESAVNKLFTQLGSSIRVVIHAAAQPSHDWAAREPFCDFSINANGTLILLEATRKFAPDAVFIFTSTNKVYGDAPNRLPLLKDRFRFELDQTHPFAQYGIDESMPIDQSGHSLFGASKVAADIMVQEYGRFFGVKTGVFRLGCVTGPAHRGVEMHGFLAYLAKCVVTQVPYRIIGHGGMQVRDNIHSYDLADAFWNFFSRPTTAAVYNLGGSRHSNCSVLEAVATAEKLSGKRLTFAVVDEARYGDHSWWISDVRKFRRDYPEWSYRYDLKAIVSDLVAATWNHRRSSFEVQLPG